MYETFLPTLQRISEAVLRVGAILVVVINGLEFHCLQWSTSMGSVRSLQPFKEKVAVACDPPCWPAIQTTEERALQKKREGRASP